MSSRGIFGTMGIYKQKIETFEEYLGIAVQQICSAYKNAFAYPPETDHAYLDMEYACGNILTAYAIFLKRQGVEISESTEDDMYSLIARVNVLQSERDNLLRTVEESPDIIDEARRETANEILQTLIAYDQEGDMSELIDILADKYGLEVKR